MNGKWTYSQMTKGGSANRKEVTKDGILEPQKGRKYNKKSKNVSKSNRRSLSAWVL